MSNPITLAERLEQASNSAAQSWIITELLLNAYPATIRQSVIAAAVPHWFTAEILAVLLDLSTEQAQERYVALQELSIVQPFGNLGCTLHDLTRSGILKNLATEESALLPYYGEKLLTYFVASFDPQHEVERIYQLLLVNPIEGRRVLQQNARFLRNKGNFAAIENLLRNYRELIDLGWLVDEHRLELEQQEYWTAEALADRGKREKDDQSEQYLRKALEQFAPPDQLARLLADEPKLWRDQIDTYKHDFVRNQIESAGLSGDLVRQPFWMTEQATIYRDQGDLVTALQELNAALALASDNVRTLAQRGETYRLMARYEEALADFDRAIALDEKMTWAIAVRGETYRLMARYEEALADFDRAIALDEKYAWAIASRGQVYQALKRYEEALADFDRAIALDEKMTWAIASRGQVYQALKRYEEALADFDRAIALDEKMTWAIAVRGETYRLMARYEEALADFDRAIALDEKYAWAIAVRGETYRLMARYEEALADFDQAIALDEKYAWAIAVRGETYRLMARYEEALADFDRAIALDEKMTWAITARGQIYMWTGDYEQGLTDFDRAIKLDDEYSEAFFERGEIYLLLGLYDKAFIEFNRVLMIDNQASWAMSRRSLLNRRFGHFNEALSDIERSIETEQSEQRKSWYLYCRGLVWLTKGKFDMATIDFQQAIELSTSIYSQDKGNWANRFNLMLYSLAVNNESIVSVLLPEILDNANSIHFLKMAIFLVRDLLTVIPEHLQAITVLQELQNLAQHFVIAEAGLH